MQLKSLRKPSTGQTEYIVHFPNHFPQGPRPCHMLGGCRSSLETGVQRDGWHTLADTLGALNISVLSVLGFFFFCRGG